MAEIQHNINNLFVKQSTVYGGEVGSGAVEVANACDYVVQLCLLNFICFGRAATT